MRYPQKPGTAIEGHRGYAGPSPERFWGLSLPEYREKADIWRLNPRGELMPWFIIENRLGVANVRDILPQLPVPPAYITAAAGGEGFAEMAQRLVEARG